MAITFDTLEYVNKLKAADVPEKQAEAQAQALRGVLDSALAEQAKIAQEASERAVAELDTKTERAVVRLDAKTDGAVSRLDAKIERLDAKIDSVAQRLGAKIELSRRDTIIWLGGMLIVGFGTVIGILFKLMG